MEKYGDKLRAYLDQKPMHYTEGDSLLEDLYWCYTEANTLDSMQLRKEFQRLYCSLPELSDKKFDEIFNVVSAISAEQEKLAFQAGVRIGLHLAAELLG